MSRKRSVFGQNLEVGVEESDRKCSGRKQKLSDVLPLVDADADADVDVVALQDENEIVAQVDV